MERERNNINSNHKTEWANNPYDTYCAIPNKIHIYDIKVNKGYP